MFLNRTFIENPKIGKLHVSYMIPLIKAENILNTNIVLFKAQHGLEKNKSEF